MIHCLRQPLPEPQRKEILDWLNLPAARKFRDCVANMAAEHSAEAGNRLADATQTEESAVLEANDHADKAKPFLAVLNVMAAMLNEDYEFVSVQFTAKPTITEQE